MLIVYSSSYVSECVYSAFWVHLFFFLRNKVSLMAMMSVIWDLKKYYYFLHLFPLFWQKSNAHLNYSWFCSGFFDAILFSSSSSLSYWVCLQSNSYCPCSFQIKKLKLNWEVLGNEKSIGSALLSISMSSLLLCLVINIKYVNFFFIAWYIAKSAPGKLVTKGKC